MQWLCTLLILVLPFIRIGDRALIRLNLPEQSLELIGTSFRIEELYLFLLLCLAGLILFLLLTMVLGRVWCGWGCPQTTLVDLVEGIARRLKLKSTSKGFTGPLGARAALQAVYAFLALLVGANLVWYCIPPVEFFPRLLQGDIGFPAAISIAIVGGLVWVDLAFLRRTFCKEFCPYGRFQTALVDPGTLTLRFHPDEAERCIKCGACVRTCPTGIDIRRGFQIECINCGRCLDACREVMARRQQKGIIRYTFGTEGKGPAALLNIRVLLLTMVFLVLSGGILYSVWHRPIATLKVQRLATVAPRILESGETAIFFTGYTKNQTTQPIRVSIEAEEGFQLNGPVTEISLEGGERKRIDFLILAPAGQPMIQTELLLRDQGKEPLAKAEVTLPPTKEN